MPNNCTDLKGIGRNVWWCAGHPLRQRLPWWLPDSRAHGCSLSYLMAPEDRQVVSGGESGKAVHIRNVPAQQSWAATYSPHRHIAFIIYTMSLWGTKRAQHKQKAISYDAEDPVNEASLTTKRTYLLKNCHHIWHLRSVSLSWDRGLYKGLSHGCMRAEPWASCRTFQQLLQ